MPPLKVISFLGRNPQDGAYVHPRDGRRCDTRFVQRALAEWFHPDAIYVLLTPTAASVPVNGGDGRSAWEMLVDAMVGLSCSLVPVHDVPEGSRREDLWKVFDLLTGCLDAGDRVIFDVTNGFRSVAVLSLLATTYLRIARDVKIEGLVYGAFDNKDAAGGAPLVDLLPVVELLDWTIATDQFIKTGVSSDLAGLLTTAHQNARKAGSTEKDEILPKRIQGIGRSLDGLSRALNRVRPLEVPERARDFSRALTAGSHELAQWAPPFAVLLDRVRDTYQPFHDDSLATQRALVRWYLDRSQILQAVSLAREWLVSWTCEQFKLDRIADRKAVEHAINAAVAASETAGRIIAPVSSNSGDPDPLTDDSPSGWADPGLLKALHESPELAALLRAWSQVRDLRNDIMHCGFRSSPYPADRLEKLARKAADLLDQLPCPSSSE